MNIMEVAHALQLSPARIRTLLRQGQESDQEQRGLARIDQTDATWLWHSATLITTDPDSGVRHWSFDMNSIEDLRQRRLKRPVDKRAKTRTTKVWKIKVPFEKHDDVQALLEQHGIEMVPAYSRKTS